MDNKPVSTPLLNTKFYFPPRPNLVPRARLLHNWIPDYSKAMSSTENSLLFLHQRGTARLP